MAEGATGSDRAGWGDQVSFGDRVTAQVQARGPLCAGIDPAPALLAAWGLPDDPSGLRAFGERCVEGFAGVVAVVKPQVAFYERHGPAGLAALVTLIAEARAAGLVVIADAKRGDIDSTAAAYADAWLGPGSPFAPDAVTVAPYLGLGALAPMVEAARATGRGMVVVVRSSNPEGRALQEARTVSGATVEDALLAEVAELNRRSGNGRGGPRLGAVGAVVGATLEPSGFPLGRLGGIVLAPGVGAQGATAADVGRRFAGCPAGSVLANVSRALLAAGPEPRALHQAAAEMNEALSEAGV